VPLATARRDHRGRRADEQREAAALALVGGFAVAVGVLAGALNGIEPGDGA
jgi:hypothetical protein